MAVAVVLDPGPGDHRGIVRTQMKRRGDKAHPVRIADPHQGAAQHRIGGNAAGNRKSSVPGPGSQVQIKRPAGLSKGRPRISELIRGLW